MARKDESGREPISYVEVKERRCSLRWADGTCQAGYINYLKDNVNLSGAEWVRFGVSATSDSSPDNHGTLKSKRFTFSGGTVSIAAATNPSDNTFSDPMYIHLEAKKLSGDGRYMNFSVNAGTGNITARIDLDNGNISNDTFDESTVTSEGNGWYKIRLGIALANRLGTGFTNFSFSFASTTAGAAPSLNSQSEIYGLMVTPVQNPPLVEVTNGPALSTIVTDQQCFNTRQTCQDPANYAEEIVPVKFIGNRSPLPRDDYYIPCLKSASVGAGELNPGGSNRSQSALGRRATFSASFQDIPHNDKTFDYYLSDRSYSPLEQGTLFSKWRARNPFYINTFLDFVTGYLFQGQVIETTTRTYVMTGFSGPDSNGSVSIQGKDILTLAEDTKAQAPKASTGKLSAGITGTPSNFTLTPSGIGDIEYPASGKVRIEKEVIQFTRSGDLMTIVTRGVNGTTSEDHDVDSVVQLCLEYTSANYSNILYDLLLNYADIPATYLDKAGWDTEVSSFSSFLYSTVISEPTSVSKLVSEMCEQMYFSVWWDERASLVKTRIVRNASDEEITQLTDDANFIANSITWTDKPDELITQAWVFYGQINVTEKLDQESNFATVEVVRDDQAEANQQTRKIKKIYSRWIDGSNASAASGLAEAIINRSANIPRELSFSVDAKDKDLWLGDFIQVLNRLNVDYYGVPQWANLQVTKASESQPGTTLTYSAKQHLVTKPFNPNEESVIIGNDVLNLNLKSYYETYISATAPTTGTVTFTIRSGVKIGGDAANYTLENIQADSRSTSNDTYDAGTSSIDGTAVGIIPMLQRQGIVSSRDIAKDATYPSTSNTADWLIKEYPAQVSLSTGTWAVGVTLKLIIESGAAILGQGGNGSAHAFKETYVWSGGPPGYTVTAQGGDGGHALQIDHPLEIDNQGVITAGAGGGASLVFTSSIELFLLPGGGGGGYPVGQARDYLDASSGRIVGVGAEQGFIYPSLQTDGGNGATGFKPASGPFPKFNYNTTSGEPEGYGGNNDFLTGQQATREDTSDSSLEYIGTGGAAGAAVISGKNDITWINKGAVYGAENV